MAKDKFFVRWSTGKELKFIKSLSVEKFIKYAQALPLRKKWGRIDKDRIARECEIILGGGNARNT